MYGVTAVVFTVDTAENEEKDIEPMIYRFDTGI
jgi:hypothetical protein